MQCGEKKIFARVTARHAVGANDRFHNRDVIWIEILLVGLAMLSECKFRKLKSIFINDS